MLHGSDLWAPVYKLPSIQSLFVILSPTDRYSDLTSQPLPVGLPTLESSFDKVVAWRLPTVNLGCT
ncbi:hypothetical protein E5345_09250 [Propionibacterium sp. NM47_B9-13]|nr:hypothetical protein HMPREF9621_02721 [Cutibacterium modestum HL037PA2]EFT14920.1 hypothetical protein HMPREF9622_02042 [Cutibacterium modestum HL037PA3]REB73047.1 hypothetical protein CP877_12135 [Cutibacterium modestum]TGY28383.1 hypothetical protein E5345_09250 [Propionibacterium sp. NM47_B9-13]